MSAWCQVGELTLYPGHQLPTLAALMSHYLWGQGLFGAIYFVFREREGGAGLKQTQDIV